MGQTIFLVSNAVEEEALAFRRAVLALAAERNTTSDALIMALADIVGGTAAVIDREVGKQDFSDRMGAFEARARESYKRAR